MPWTVVPRRWRQRGRTFLSASDRLLLAAATTFVLSVVVASVTATDGRPVGDPTTDPQPELEAFDARKSVVVTLTFDGRTDVSVDNVEVGFGGAPARLGNPPLLRIDLVDGEGGSLDTFDAWHPLWVFQEGPAGGESRAVRSTETGELIFPFDRDAITALVSDVALGEQVVEVDLGPAIRSFCTANPAEAECRVADLAIADMGVASVPAWIPTTGADSFEIQTTLANNGPTTPVDGALELTVAAPGGVTVAPVSTTQTHTVPAGSPVADTQTFAVTCLASGRHVVTVSGAVAPAHPADVDPEPGNDQRSTTVIINCAVEVAINILPGGYPNPINLGARGVIPVAVLTTMAGEYGTLVPFEASQIDPANVRFGTDAALRAGGGAAPFRHRMALEDSYELDEETRDGDLDGVLSFVPRSDTGLGPSDTEACVVGDFTPPSGETFTFVGCDDVIVR
jgi:hypothetical protein